jgi:type IV pilus assembly protein PilV
MKKSSRHPAHQTGVGMVEVLVALVVMSVGMLGIASLYTTTLQAKTTSLSRMKAVNLTYDMADRIRANPTAVASYALADTGTTTATDCNTAACTPTNLAASDLAQWDALVTDATTGLPGGNNVKRAIAVTAATATTPALVNIQLTWREASTGIADLTYALQVEI